MKRKLIQFNEFEELKNNSLSATVQELVEAEDIIAQKLGEESVTLVSFDEGVCVFEAADGTFLRAAFDMEDGNIVLEGIERLVLDEETEKEKGTSILETVLKALIKDDGAAADKAMDEYIALDIQRQRRTRYAESIQHEVEMLSEEDYKVRLYGTRGKGGRPKLFARKGSKNQDKARAAKLGHARHPSSYKVGASKRKRKISQERSRRKMYKSSYPILRAKSGGVQYTGRRKRRMLAEWLKLSGNVFGFIDHMENGSALAEARLIENHDGSATLTVSIAHKRNEGKVLMMQYDLLKTDLKILRESARRLIKNQGFCQLVAEARKANALSDDKHLEDSLRNLSEKFPEVLYMTGKEMAGLVAEALKAIGVKSFDDETCAFLADGIQRTAVEMYSERVGRIVRASGFEAKGEVFDDYAAAATEVFPKLDESTKLEFKMFEDLFNATQEVRRMAHECQNDAVKNDAHTYLGELDEILSGRQPQNFELAVEVAGWLETLAETNLEGENWDVVKTAYRTVNGDNPQMAKNARKPYAPASDFSGDWGDVAPVSDGKNYKGGLADEMRGKAWGNIANKDTYPDLDNPYTPESGNYTMPHDKGVDKDDDNFGTWQDGDTWPKLHNPYIPAAQIPKQKVDPSNPVE
ncbi:MAG: hypothetical protein MN733_33435 [Nitrososphaera sp.]|nr:hypothetical protein [Nitrososphaera sp.]